MKKKILFLVFGLIIFQTKIFAQCNQTTASDTLDVNNINALIMNGGDMWWNRALGAAHYYVPKANRVSTLFAGAIWMGGYDAAGQLHVAAQTYRQGGNDYFSGPLDATGNVNTNTCSQYDKIWKIYATDIATHISNAMHTIANTPTSLLEWPAKGNPYAKGAFGSSLTINQTLAPFIDVNNDGIYNPLDGDYPNICGDEALWYVINDKGNTHTESSGMPLGVEIQCMAYSFSSANAAINNTTFYKYYIVNKSNYVYDSFHFGIWVDYDLGCYTDDYFGSDSSRQMFIAYNSTATDNPCPIGYGTNIPMQGIALLNAKNYNLNANYKTKGIYFYANGSGYSGNPTQATQYYQYLTGSWLDGTHLTYGGNGHGGTITSNYAFPSSPSLSGTNPSNGQPYWSWCNPTQTPSDLRSLISVGPIKLRPGDTTELDFAAITHWRDVYPCPSFAGIEAARDSVFAFYNTLSCGKYGSQSTGVNSVSSHENSFSVYPNPTNNKVYINNPSHESFTVHIFDVTGKELQHQNCSQSINEIDLTDYNSGIYFYSIENKSTTILQRGKLVKQ